MINHISILKNEIVNYLLEDCTQSRPFFADLTFGGGGHSKAIKESCQDAAIKAVDKDPDIIKKSILYFKDNKIDYIDLIHSDFCKFTNVIETHWPDVIQNNGFNGIIMDLGISSYQIDHRSRGFSFRFDAPLDMRMNFTDDSLTAAQIVNEYSQEQIAEILFLYGGERFSRRIAENIIKQRKISAINNTKELENIVFHSYPKKLRYNRTHPATKTFQALRIVVNDELNSLEENLSNICRSLKKGGVITVLTFHSLEDRIVKHIFKELSIKEDFRLVEKKAIKPTKNEISLNPRARSAKLRILKRLN